jgi:uncharacterized membrane protein
LKPKIIVTIMIIGSFITTLLWTLGLIFANINLFIISMIMVVISFIPAIKYYKVITGFFKTKNGEIVADERKEHIEEKATLPAYAVMLSVSIYSGIGLITLRNIYPEYVNLAYPFIIIVILGLISYMISNLYYKRKYGN